MQLQMAKYETHRAVVRLSGEVNNASIFALCDEIDLALDYYKYPAVEIQIDSPGGHVDSLDYYLTRLRSWRDRGLKVSTLAMTQTASAAAIVLALGDIGSRRAYPSARLLFHRSRTQPQRMMTADDLMKTKEALDGHDRRIDALLSEQVFLKFAAAGKQPACFPVIEVPGCVEARPCPNGVQQEDVMIALAALQRDDRLITPQDAISLYLIDAIEA